AGGFFGTHWYFPYPPKGDTRRIGGCASPWHSTVLQLFPLRERIGLLCEARAPGCTAACPRWCGWIVVFAVAAAHARHTREEVLMSSLAMDRLERTDLESGALATLVY